jgi:hypothetical protein
LNSNIARLLLPVWLIARLMDVHAGFLAYKLAVANGLGLSATKDTASWSKLLCLLLVMLPAVTPAVLHKL